MSSIRAETLKIIKDAMYLLNRVKAEKASKREIISYLEDIISLGIREFKEEELVYEEVLDAERSLHKGDSLFDELDNISKDI